MFTRNIGYQANAGPDLCAVDGTYHAGGVVCGINGRGWLRVTLTGNPPPSGGTGTWSVVSSNAEGCVYGSSNGTSSFSGKPSGNYVLRYTITVNGFMTYDDMNVCFNSCRYYTITRNGGVNQYTFDYRTCTDLAAPLNSIANGASKTVCAFPGSVSTSWPTNIIITTNNVGCN
jgi:hypothetical protein